MSARVSDDEYRAIKASWRSGSDDRPRTNADMLAACRVNFEEAKRRERALVDQWDGLPVGDPRFVGDAETPPLKMLIHMARGDQFHWLHEQEHWEREIARQGPDFEPPLFGRGEVSDRGTKGTLLRLAAVPPVERRLPRESEETGDW